MALTMVRFPPLTFFSYFPDYSSIIVIWSYMVLEKLNKFTNISIEVRFIFVDIN